MATAAAVWWTFTRPEIRLMVGLLVVALAAYAWRHGVGRRAATISAGFLVIALAWVTLITPTVGRTFSGWSATGLTLEEGTFIYRLRLQVLPNPAIRAVFRDKLGMPECAGTDRVAAGSAWAMAEFADAYRACPELRAWGEANAGTSGYRFGMVAPREYAGYTADVLPRSLAGATYASVPRVVPEAVEREAFPSWQVVPRSLLGGFAVALVAVLLAGAVNRRPLLLLTGAIVAVASLVCLLAALMYSVGEFERFGIQEAIGLRLGLVLLFVAAVDSAAERFGGRPREAVPEAAAMPETVDAAVGRTTAPA